MKILSVIFLLIFSEVAVFAQKEDEQLAKQYMQTGEVEKAADLYQKLYGQDNNAYYSPYYNSLLSLRKFDEAESITKKMIAQHPKNYRFVVALGRIYGENNDQGKAVAIYDDLLKNMPADAEAIGNIASEFSRAQNADYAIKTYIQGRKRLNDDRLFAWELANQYRNKKDKPAMLKELLTQLVVKPEYAQDVKRTISATFESPQDYNQLKTELLEKIKQNPEQVVYADLLTWQFLQQKQFDSAMDQALALDRQQSDDGKRIYELCQTLADNEVYDEAIRGYEYLVGKGKKAALYEIAKIQLTNTKKLKMTAAQPDQAAFASLEKDYLDLLAEFGQTTITAIAMENLAKLQAYDLNKPAAAEKTLADLIAIPGLRADSLGNYKLQLGDIYLINDKPWDASLIQSQVEKALPGTPVGQEAQYRNARLAFYTGDFTWAKEQLDVLKAETSQLIDNDALNLSLMIEDHTAFDSTANALKMYARAELLIVKGAFDRAVMTLDSIDKVYPVNDLVNDILMAKARIQIQKRDYKAAVEPLKKIATESPADLWADDAVFMLGDIYQKHLADNIAAQSWYQKIIADYPGSLWISEARKRFRTLRGDVKADL